MIRHLIIRGFRLLDETDLELEPGLVAITGETGAGKSLLLKAIGLALGKEADAEMLDQVQGQALAQVLMEVAPEWVEEKELTPGDAPGEVLFSRDVRNPGRSQCKVNGEMLPQRKVAELGALVLDVHSQDARLLLKDETRQLMLFDHWAGPEVRKQKEKLKEVLPRWKAAQAALKAFEENQAALEEELDSSRLSLKDIENGALGEEQENDLRRQEQALKSHARLVELLGAGLDALEGVVGGALRRLGEAAKRLGELSQLLNEFEGAARRLDHLCSAATELAHELHTRLEEATEGGGNLDDIQEKLFAHEKLLKRFRLDTPGLAAHRERLAARVAELENTFDDPEVLKREEVAARKELDKVLAALAAAREKRRPAFEKAMAAALKELAFAQVRFQVGFHPLPGGQIKKDTGDQRVMFEVSFTPGEPPRAVGTVASGGEVNRLGLALKAVLAEHFDTPCLIFDEVDAGVGGDVAMAMGRQLVALSQDRQVLAITHNHWVAAQAHQHLAVNKRVEKGKTFISLRRLSAQEREDELVRMLGEGGGSATSARQFAKELLKTQSKK